MEKGGAPCKLSAPMLELAVVGSLDVVAIPGIADLDVRIELGYLARGYGMRSIPR